MLVIKRYSAKWCIPCQQLAPVFSEIQSELTNEIDQIVFETIDVDQNTELTLQNNITSVPTVILEKEGKQLYRFSGVLPKSVIIGIIKKHL
jgi:thioredoxin 1